jgi:hypothetical protein
MTYRATTYAKLLESACPGLVVVAQIGVHQIINAFTLTSGKTITYECPIVQNRTAHGDKYVTSVTVTTQSSVSTDATPIRNEPTLRSVEPESLTERTSIALVEANPGSFFYDGTVSKVYVSMTNSADPWARHIAVGFMIYVTTGDAISPSAKFIDDQGNQYWPYLSSIPSTRKSVSDPFYGVVQQSTGTLVLLAGTGNLDSAWADYIWEHGTVKILMGGDSLPFSQYTGPGTFRISGTRWSDVGFELSLSDASADLLVTIPRAVGCCRCSGG